MKQKVLRITVRNGRLLAIYDDRLVGLIARLGGARSSDGRGDTAARCDVDSSSRRDDSRLAPRHRSGTGQPEDARVAEGRSCKTGSSTDGAPLETDGCAWSGGLASERRGSRGTSAVQDDAECVHIWNTMRVVEPSSSLIITRASMVEPGPEGGWTADMAPVGGGVLGPYPLRTEALAAEQAWLRQERGL